MRGGAFFNGKEGRDDFRTPFLNGKEGRDDFRKTAPEGGYILSLRARERLGERCGIPIPHPTTLPSVL